MMIALQLSLLLLPPILGGAIRRAIGGWTITGEFRGAALRSLTFVPALPLFAVLPWQQAVVPLSLAYIHTLAPTGSYLSMGRSEGHTFEADFSRAVLWNSIGPMILTASMLIGLFPFGRTTLLIGPVTASIYAIAWWLHDRKRLPTDVEPTNIGEVGIGSVYWLSVSLTIAEHILTKGTL